MDIISPFYSIKSCVCKKKAVPLRRFLSAHGYLCARESETNEYLKSKEYEKVFLKFNNGAPRLASRS